MNKSQPTGMQEKKSEISPDKFDEPFKLRGVDIHCLFQYSKLLFRSD